MGTDPITDQLSDSSEPTGATTGAGVPSDNTTLTEVLRRYDDEGFSSQFAARPGGDIHCYTCGQDHDPGRGELVSLRRLEGASDPDDMLAIAALRCPSCGARGTAVLGYGPDSAPEDGELLIRLEDMRGAEPSIPPDAAPGEVAERTGGGS